MFLAARGPFTTALQERFDHAPETFEQALDDTARAPLLGVDARGTGDVAAEQPFKFLAEVVAENGQKIQFGRNQKVAVRRPDGAASMAVGDRDEIQFVYDGKTLTLHNPRDKAYAQMAAPDTLEGMLDFAREKLDIVAPAGDMIYENAYDILMDEVTDGFVVGKAVIEGVRCDHLAFRAPHVDWQIWIQEGEQPLPRKLVITTRDLVNAPQFAVTVTDWNMRPTFDAQTFVFTPPADATKVDFLPR